MTVKLTEAQTQEALALYLAGESLVALGVKFGVAGESLSARFKRRGVKLRSQKLRDRRMSEAEFQEAVALYRDGWTFEALGARFRVTRSALTRRFKARGVPARVRGVARRPMLDGAFDERSEASAYWMGFLLADGYMKERVGRASPALIVKLSVVDEAHLARLSAFVGGGSVDVRARTSGYTATPSAALAWRSRPHFAALERWGVLGLKYGRGPLHPDLAADRHFWRGVVDGDGWITRRPVRSTCAVGLIGNEETGQAFQAFGAAHGVRFQAPEHRKGMVYSRAQGTQAALLAEVLWGGASVYLPRKAEKASELWGTAFLPLP